MLTLWCKKAKIFIEHDGDRERKFVAEAANHPVQAPEWVKKNLGYKMGVKDGSIVDLTPPKLPAVVTVTAVNDPKETVSVVTASLGGSEESVDAPDDTEDLDGDGGDFTEDTAKSVDDLEDEAVAHTQPGKRTRTTGGNATGLQGASAVSKRGK